MQGVKTGDSCEDGGFEASKTTTATRMATPRGSIPVTVGTVEAWGVGVGGIPLGGLANREPRTYIYIYIHIHTYICVYLYTCVYTCVYIYTSICVCVYIYIHAFTVASSLQSNPDHPARPTAARSPRTKGPSCSSGPGEARSEALGELSASSAWQGLLGWQTKQGFCSKFRASCFGMTRGCSEIDTFNQ